MILSNYLKMDLSDIPTSMKSIQHYLKIASQHDSRDLVISYWGMFFIIFNISDIVVIESSMF